MQQIGVDRIGRFAPFVGRNINAVFFRIFDEFGAGIEVPFAPGRDHFNIRVERVITQFKADLIIALAGGAVTHGICADLMGDFDLTFGNQGARDGCAQKIEPFIQSIGAKHRKNEVANKFFAQIINIDFFDTIGFGLRPRRLQFFALTQIGREGDNFTSLFFLKPFQDDGCVQSAGIGEDDFLGCAHDTNLCMTCAP